MTLNVDLEGDLWGYRDYAHWNRDVDLPPVVDFCYVLKFKLLVLMVFKVWPWTLTLKVTPEVIVIGLIELAMWIYPQM